MHVLEAVTQPFATNKLQHRTYLYHNVMNMDDINLEIFLRELETEIIEPPMDEEENHQNGGVSTQEQAVLGAIDFFLMDDTDVVGLYDDLFDSIPPPNAIMATMLEEAAELVKSAQLLLETMQQYMQQTMVQYPATVAQMSPGFAMPAYHPQQVTPGLYPFHQVHQLPNQDQQDQNQNP